MIKRQTTNGETAVSPFTKAKLIVLLHGVPSQVIPVQFNPNELKLGANANWEKRENLNSYQFTGSTNDELTLTLFFDSYQHRDNPDLRDVRNHGPRVITSLLEPIVQQELKLPPRLIFSWGVNFTYEGYLKSVGQNYTLFLPDGTPARVTLTVTLIPYTPPKVADMLSTMRMSRKFWKVKYGDRLDLIASAIYGKPELWKVIADANSIKDPLSFPETKTDEVAGTTSDIGRVLVIPHIEA